MNKIKFPINLYTKRVKEETKLKELEKELIDSHVGLEMLNASLDQISILKPEYIKHGLPNLKNRKDNALAKNKLTKNKNALLDEYIKIIVDHQLTNTNTRTHFRNLKKHYNNYTQKYLALNNSNRNHKIYGIGKFENFESLNKFKKYRKNKKIELSKKGTQKGKPKGSSI